jgi:uncharacterized protein (DUF1684 family)
MVRYGAALLLLACAAGCTSGPRPVEDDNAYVAEIQQHRDSIDRMFRETPGQPIPPDKIGTLLPLNYYPIDRAWTVPAELQLSDNPPTFQMPTSTGTLRNYQLIGTLVFSLQGEQRSLGAFVEAGQPIDTLFVPFADLTTGTDTYPAGRYLDVPPTSTGFYEIDFNRAYNPYCAYNASYECPYPPASNRLKIAVTAGEKIPSEEGR